MQWLDLCNEQCTRKDDPILQILEGGQRTTLTFPETIISSRNTGNLTRSFLGLTIGGKEATLHFDNI